MQIPGGQGASLYIALCKYREIMELGFMLGYASYAIQILGNHGASLYMELGRDRENIGQIFIRSQKDTGR